MHTHSRSWQVLLRRQEHAVTVRQALRHGFSRDAVAAQVEARRWQRVGPAVYVTFSGPLPESTRRWVALLCTGDGAILSHGTAAEIWGLRHAVADRPVDVMIGAHRRILRPPGVRIHRSRLIATSTCPDLLPPRATVEATAFDLSDRLGDGIAVMARAMQLRLTTGPQLLAELDRRPTQRWRPALREALGGVEAGAHSLLELRYLRDVERAHALPGGQRQRRAGRTFQDVYYEAYRLAVELDGRLGHADADSVWRDMARDNASVIRAETTLRYGWADVTGRPCQVARQVGVALRQRGWPGPADPSKCGACAGL
jgi:very-short-patch-repair endonuclease